MDIGNPLPHVAAIPPYPPGRPVDAVAREYGLDPATIVKLASNENPLGCSPAVARAIAALADRPNIYPDFDCYDLRHAIAAHVGLSPERVLPGEGSSEILCLAVRAYLAAGRDALIPQYSFQAYEGQVRSVGANAIIVPARDFAIDVDAVLAAVTPGTHLLFVGTPNNPTGLALSPGEIDRLVDALPDRVLLVLDEAYREFVDPAMQPDVAALLARRRTMLVLRTFSKVHGLAGLRVGYALGDAEMLQMLRRLQLPFSVSSVAQAAAIAAISDGDFAERSRVLNGTERARLISAIDERGLRYLPSSGNFVMVEVGDGPSFARALMARGVIVRPIANYGLPGWIRVSVGLPAENDRFLDAFDAVSAAAAV